jgi:hypothetical protein
MTRGPPAPGPVEHLVSAMMALETGLSLQHYVDPEAAAVDLLPELFDLLLGRWSLPAHSRR